MVEEVEENLAGPILEEEENEGDGLLLNTADDEELEDDKDDLGGSKTSRYWPLDTESSPRDAAT